MARCVRRGASLLFIVVFVLAPAGAARADGDPASDILYTQSVFIPFDTGISQGAQETLATAVAEADRSGYPIRVAVIEKEADLAAVTVLWGKPKQYAHFLDIELSFAFQAPPHRDAGGDRLRPLITRRPPSTEPWRLFAAGVTVSRSPRRGRS